MMRSNNSFMSKYFYTFSFIMTTLLLTACGPKQISVKNHENIEDVYYASLSSSKVITSQTDEVVRLGTLEQDLKFALLGNPVAQNNMGIRYQKGLSVPRNYTTAFQWFKKSAAQGFAKAATNVGVAYSLGHGVDKNKHFDLIH